ncbi:recombinase, partial [Candidatus Uhrbacteria bacterium]|nr:recombinase [Candidatus Uhrbacteria bacterium]MBD3284286.1 recombinase [Candidatus Uhrbacteria bacterium]
MKEAYSKPKLLLHACCGVCSSYIPELLVPDFEVTLYFENSNIYPSEEFQLRAEAARAMADAYGIPFVEVKQDPTAWHSDVRGHATESENGPRCQKCMRHRMRKAFAYAKDHGFDYVTTTMSVSRNKVISTINEIGYALSEEFGIPYIDRDWKKNGGEDASQRRSKNAGIYRQRYCGCVYSKVTRDR